MSKSELIQLRLKMVGAAKMSDIVFVFKNEDKFLHAHKAILSINCVVFERMLCGEFPAPEQVEIVDIQYAVFVEIIKYIYTMDTSSLLITTDNMLELIYASQKYCLTGLKEFVLNFIKNHTNNSNLLNILDFTQYFERSSPISLKIICDCLDAVIDNPLPYFSDPRFLTLSATTLNGIVRNPRINCTGEQLRMCVLKWLQAQIATDDEIELNEDTYQALKAAGIAKFNLQDKMLQLKQHYVDDGIFFHSYQENRSAVNNKQKIYLHGLGIYAGIFPEKANAVPFDQTLKIRLYEITDVKSKTYDFKRTHIQSIQQKNSTFIQQVMFGKVLLEKPFLIEVDFGVDAVRPSFPVVPFSVEQFSGEQFLKGPLPVSSQTEGHHPFTCIAYFLYSEVEESDDELFKL